MSLVVERTSCRTCGGQLAYLMDLGEQLVRWDKPEKAPLVLTKCSRCGLVQLRHTVSRDYLFKEGYPYRSGATQTMRDHLKGIVDDVMKRVELKPTDIVVDIGSNDGTLLGFYHVGTRVGFEPSELGKETLLGPLWISDFFSTPTFQKFIGFTKKAKVITAIAMFYDLEDPNAFLQDVKKVLAPDGLFVLQVNYLPDTLKNNAVGDICHEHLEYYTLGTLAQLLERNGFLVDGVSFNSINGGSVRVFARHHEYSDTAHNWIQTALEHGETDMDFAAFSLRVSTACAKVKGFLMHAKDQNKVVDIMGASTRGGTFLQAAKIDGTVCRFTVERDPSKIGKAYLGTLIVSEDVSTMNPPDYKLVGPYWFLDEILTRETRFVNTGGKLIVPLPTPRIIDKDGEHPL
ncbi:MAG TPA: class I SAM-dependent methyltransferase [Nitrososphaerales archaeon]|nr:class I SAM-dependent methyltransferase [Nitrososphaerales archaeon]